MNLTELQTAWNELRNAALGRGVTPLVPQPLADRVGNTYERWRVWLANFPPWKLQEILIDPVTAPEPWAWLKQYRALSAEVTAALKQRGNTAYKPMPPNFIEQTKKKLDVSTAQLGKELSELGDQLGDLSLNTLYAVAAVGVFALLVTMFGKRGNS
jgi:hypothetical protein